MRGLVSATLILLIFRKVNWTALEVVLRELDVRWALLGSATTALLIGTLALRWRIFLQKQDIHVPYSKVFSLTWAGQFFNSLLPGSTGGDVVKIIAVCRLVPDRKAAAAASVLVDRLTALFALLVLAGLAVGIYPKPVTLVPLPPLHTPYVVALAIAACAMGLVTVWLLDRVTSGSHIHGKIVRTLLAAKSNLRLDWKLPAAVLLAFTVHLLNFAIIFFFARALAISITYGQVLLMMPVILFLLMVPITINGHGLREMLLIAYFGSMGVVIANHTAVNVRETAVALSLVAVTNDLLWALPGGLWYLIRTRSPGASPDSASSVA